MLTNQLTVLLLFVVISAESSREFLSIAHAGHSPWLSNLTRRELINVKRICGRESRKHEPIFKISGGDKAAKGQFPWAVGLAYRKGEAFCGATIISQKHIISAAHCFFSYVKGSLPCMGIATQDPFSIEVHYGGTCTRRGTHCSKANTKIARIRKVRYARAFHEFNCKGGSDIAIAEIEGSFQFDDLVKPICLPPIAEAKEFNSTAYSTFTDYGFGLLDEKDSHTVAHLRYIDFPPSAIDVTDDRGYIVVVPGKRSGRLMNKGICKGDSGSGFQARRISDQRVYLQGMHSFGPPCGSGLSYWNTHVVGDSLEFPGGLEEFEGLWGAAAGNLAPRTCCTFFLSSAKNPNVWLYGFVLNEGGILTIDEIKQRDLRGLRIGTINLTFLDPKLYLFKVTAEVLVSNLLPFACRFFGYAQEFVFSTYQLPSNPAVENSIFQTVYSFHEPRNVALSYSGQQSQQFLAQLLKSRKLEILMLRYYWPTETLHTVFTRLKETQIKVFYTRVCDAKINTALLTEMHNFWISGQFESTKVDLSFRAGHLEGVDDMFPDKKEYGVDKQWNVEHILYGTFELTVMGNYSLEVKINPAT